MNQVAVVTESRELAPATGAADLLSVIARAAADPSVDVAKIRGLWEIREEVRKTEAKQGFVAALAEFKRSPPRILKGKHVQFTARNGSETNYRHATLADVSDAVAAGLQAHGLTFRFSTRQEAEKIRVTCILTHEQGHSEETTLEGSPDDSGGKNRIQAVGSAVTYLQRYTLLAALGLATHDMDDRDGRAPGEAIEGEPRITESQAADLRALLQEHGKSLDKLLAWARISKLEDLPASKFAAACAGARRPRAEG
jgi:hypothetical protein